MLSSRGKNAGETVVRRQRDHAELVGMLEHLGYEVQMLHSTGLLLIGGFTVSGHLHNAVLESFAIHCRAIIDFLFPPDSARGDDVTAAKYVADAAAWQQARGNLPSVLLEARKKAHKQIAHLTFTRGVLAQDDKAWRPRLIVAELERLLGLFRAHARPEFSDYLWRVGEPANNA